MRKTLERLIDGFTGLVILAALYFLLRPDSSARAAWTEFRDARESAQTAKRLWHQIATTSHKARTDSRPPLVVEVLDYECTYCRRAHASLDSAVNAGAMIAYLHFPSPARERAREAALAAMCADRTGQFPVLHRRLMTAVQWRYDGDWEREAREAGIADLSSFLACMEADSTLQALETHLALADSLAIRATPTFLTPSRVYVGIRDLTSILALADGAP